jgi:predicted ATPase
LVDVGIIFGQEEMLFGHTPEEPGKRKGAINFIVGVNGTGKSSLLRALYQSFRALKVNQLPAMPLTLAWDRLRDNMLVTCLLHCPNGEEGKKPWFGVFSKLDEFDHPIHWQALIHRQEKFLEEHPEIHRLHHVGDGNEVTSSLLQAYLPQRLVAYTSGAELLWDSLEQPKLTTDLIEDGTGNRDDDRPPGWSIEREWETERPVQLTNTLTRFASKTMGEPMAGAPSGVSSLKPEAVQKLIAELEPMSAISRKVSRNQQLRAGKNVEPSFRVRTRDLCLAAVSVGLWQTAKELKGKNSEGDREILRKTLLDQQQKNLPGDDARRVLNALNWFWPTHLSFTYRDADDRVSKKQHEQLLSLLALSDEVTAQPRGRFKAVISLGPASSLDLRSRLKDVLPYGLTSATLELIADTVQDSPTGAEAVMRVFSNNKDLDTTLVEVFEELRKWQETGLLEDITLTVKRLNRVKAADGEEDDVVVTYDHFSDGEQALLGRMALLFLIRRQDGTLLLLDEPETHFNDVWKREMIDLIDDAILKTTAAQVLLATHTSIALSDVFSSEIVRFSKVDGIPKAEDVAFPTFGADPGRILLHVFGSKDTIGSRAAEFLREKLRKHWTTDNRDELEKLVNEIGSGWPRAKLAEILSKLDAPPGS